MENNYYIYFHINLVSNEVFYVGKGNRSRAFSKWNRNRHWNNIVNKYGYRVEIIENNLSNDISLQREKLYINLIGRKDLGLGPLVNHTDGGDGGGINPSQETRKKRSEALIGNQYRLAIKHTEQTKQKIRDYIDTEQTRKNKSNSAKGRIHTEDTKSKMKQNSGKAIKIKYNDNIYNSITDLWKNEFFDIKLGAFKQRIKKGKIIFERI
jgi:hypothetical protein